MKVLYDYQAFILQKYGGISRVFYELVRYGVCQSDITCRVFAGLHRNRYLKEASVEVKQNTVGFTLPYSIAKHRLTSRTNMLPYAWYTHVYQPDICHSTLFEQHILCRQAKLVITVHDMIDEIFPGIYAKRYDQALKKKKISQRADGIICVSETTRRDLLRLYSVDSEKIKVIYNGNSMEGVIPSDRKPSFPYILYIGKRDVFYKNFDILLRAFGEESGFGGLHLICFGGGALTKAELLLAKRYGILKRIHYTEGNDSDLAAYYKRAEALIYPSKYEGFGLVPLEAMSFSCPIVVSSANSIIEVVGDAGFYFDPNDIVSLKEQIQLVLTDKKLRLHKVKAGIERAKEFSWKRCGKESFAFYRKLLDK